MSDGIEVFDRQAVRRHRERAARLADSARDPGFLFDEVADRLIERLDDVRRAFPLALDLSARDGRLGRALLRRSGTEKVVQADLAFGFAARARAANRFVPTLVADVEMLPFAEQSVDLVASCLNLHWANDLPGALIQINRTLRPDGLLLGALFGGQTLMELRDVLTAAELETAGGAGPRVSPFADVRDMGTLLQRAGFAMPVVDRDTITVTYEHALSLMYDLRAMGETNAVRERRRAFTRRDTLLRAAELYLQRHADRSGRLLASFDVIFITAWAPGPGQPKPLRPGTAQHRLADALAAEEVPLGGPQGD